MPEYNFSFSCDELENIRSEDFEKLVNDMYEIGCCFCTISNGIIEANFCIDDITLYGAVVEAVRGVKKLGLRIEKISFEFSDLEKFVASGNVDFGDQGLTTEEIQESLDKGRLDAKKFGWKSNVPRSDIRFKKG